MDIRYFVLGLNVLLISILIAIYALIQGIYSLAGVALAIAVFGATALVTGFSALEPSLDTLHLYIGSIHGLTVRILEDANLIDAKMMCIPDTNEVKIVVSHEEPCTEIPSLGLTTCRGKPAIAFTIPRVVEYTASEGIEGILVDTIVNRLAICTSASALQESNRLSIVLKGINKALKPYLDKPLDPVSILVLAIVSQISNRSVVLEKKNRVEQDSIQLTVRFMQ